jgi:hypothetical protein
MDLSALHTAIRDMAKGIEPDMTALDGSDRAAVRDLKSRARKVGDIRNVSVEAEAHAWIAPTERK